MKQQKKLQRHITRQQALGVPADTLRVRLIAAKVPADQVDAMLAKHKPGKSVPVFEVHDLFMPFHNAVHGYKALLLACCAAVLVIAIYLW